MRNTKINNKLLQLGELASGDGHGTVFSFCRGTGYCYFFCVLGNGTCVEPNKVSGGGAAGSGATPLV